MGASNRQSAIRAVIALCIIFVAPWHSAAYAEAAPEAEIVLATLDLEPWQNVAVSEDTDLGAKDQLTILRRTIRVIRDDGSTFHIVEFVNKVITPKGMEEGSERRYFFANSHSSPRVIKARTYFGGASQDVRDEGIRLAPRFQIAGIANLEDAQMLTISPAGVRPGAVIQTIVVFEDTFTAIGGVWFDRESLDRGPTLRNEYILVAPRTETFICGGEASADSEVVEKGPKMLWRWNWGPTPGHAQPFWHADDEMESSFFIASPATWQDIGRWYDGITRDLIEPTPAVRLLAASIAAGKTDTREILRTLYDFCREQVRYVSIELGGGGYRPRSPDDVIDARYGDCKDKAVLLCALYAARGIVADVALVNTGGRTDSAVPSPGWFSHAIVHVPSQPGISEPMFLDPTSRRTPLGCLPTSLYGKAALIIETDPRLEHIREARPEDHSISFICDYELRPDAIASLKLRMTRSPGFTSEWYEDGVRDDTSRISGNLHALFPLWGFTPRSETLAIRTDDDGSQIITWDVEIDILGSGAVFGTVDRFSRGAGLELASTGAAISTVPTQFGFLMNLCWTPHPFLVDCRMNLRVPPGFRLASGDRTTVRTDTWFDVAALVEGTPESYAYHMTWARRKAAPSRDLDKIWRVYHEYSEAIFPRVQIENRSIALFSSGDIAGALRLADERLAADPGDVLHRYILVALLDQAGDSRRADMLLNVDVEPSRRTLFQFLKGRRLAERGETTFAFRLLDAIPAGDPLETAALRARLLNTPCGGSDSPAHLQLASHLRDLAPKDPDAHYEYALRADWLFLVDEARKGYEEAIRLNPYAVKALHNLASLNQRFFDLVESRRLFQRELQMGPWNGNFADALTHLGELDVYFGDDDAAADHLQQALRIYAGQPTAIEIRGMLELLGRRSEAGSYTASTVEKTETGNRVHITYDRGDGLSCLHSTTGRSLVLHWGVDGWKNVRDNKMPSNGQIYSITVDVDSEISKVDYVFRDELQNWDNNNGLDWHIGVNAQALGSLIRWKVESLPDSRFLVRFLYDAEHGNLTEIIEPVFINWKIDGIPDVHRAPMSQEGSLWQGSIEIDKPDARFIWFFLEQGEQRETYGDIGRRWGIFLPTYAKFTSQGKGYLP